MIDKGLGDIVTAERERERTTVAIMQVRSPFIQLVK